MTESFFPSYEEDYQAAAWLAVLRALGRRASSTTSVSASVSIGKVVNQKPETLYDELARIQDTNSSSGGRYFLEQSGILDADTRKYTQAFSDAALLLCNEETSRVIREETSFSRLMPIVDELDPFLYRKYLSNEAFRQDELLQSSQRIQIAREEAAFYLSQYDA